MIEKLFLHFKNTIRKIDMKINRKKYGYVDKLPKNIKFFDGGLYDAVLDASYKWPHNIAIEYYDKQVTYKEFIKRINKVACGLKALGVQKGDRVTICMPNTPEAVYMFYAINEIGAVANMTHPLSSEKELEYYLNKSASKVMLCIDIAYPKLKNIIDNTKLEKVIITSATKSMEKITSFIYWLTKGRKLKVKESTQIMLWNHFIKNASNYVGNPHTRVNSEDEAIILYSGGTTGKSKGVLLSNLNFNAQALEAKYYAPDILGHEAAFLTFLPNFHAFGIGICTHLPLYWGGKVILIPDFSAKKFKKYLRKYHFNILCAVPTLYEFLTKVKFRKNELKNLKAVISGGDAMSLPLKQKTNEFLAKYGCTTDVQIGYGLTEASGVIAFSPVGIKDSSDIIGYPFPNCEFLIRDLKTEKEAYLGKDGEILISGPNTMIGYLDDPEETENSFVIIKDKTYLKTGDIGFIDKKGLLHYKSRLKRMIITNGYNVYPSHVESIIMMHKSVKKCAVVGVPDKNRGEIVKAFIVLKENEDGILVKNAIQKLLKTHLAKYELPRETVYLDDLPLTKMNKVDFVTLSKM